MLTARPPTHRLPRIPHPHARQRKLKNAGPESFSPDPIYFFLTTLLSRRRDQFLRRLGDPTLLTDVANNLDLHVHVPEIDAVLDNAKKLKTGQFVTVKRAKTLAQIELNNE